ncbi:hypothetical protein [Bifidobacterium sp. AGR2158]|uniref:hypothetical protein n=1 Tax=Bifidobacterium sp. AGR2158 TaxID=1280675 RepID=UPI0004227EAE|nr:hypothetical protein [Bifidobacterium sp. AGR2158]
MTTTHDTSISWTDCPVCAWLRRELELATELAEQAWDTFSLRDATYREELDAGMVGFGTKEWKQWHDLLDQLRHAYYAAADAQRGRLAAWGDSIREHAKPQTQEAATEAETTDAAATETDDAADETEEAAQERPKVACVLFDAAYRLTTLVADTTDNPDAKAALAGIDALLFNLGYTDDDGRRFDKTAPADGEGEPK